jgi:hypothetical protein
MEALTLSAYCPELCVSIVEMKKEEEGKLSGLYLATKDHKASKTVAGGMLQG